MPDGEHVDQESPLSVAWASAPRFSGAMRAENLEVSWSSSGFSMILKLSMSLLDGYVNFSIDIEEILASYTSTNALDMEDKLAHLFYKRTGGSSSQIQPTFATLTSLALSILEIDESFVASHFSGWGYLVSVNEGASLGQQPLQSYMPLMDHPFEKGIISPLANDAFVPELSQYLRQLISQIELASHASYIARPQRLPFNGNRALLSLATLTEPLTMAGLIAAPIKLPDALLKWLYPREAQMLYVYASNSKDGLVQRASEHIYYHLRFMRDKKRPSFIFYFSFDSVDVRSRSLSDMLWTFLNHMSNSRSPMDLFLDRLYEEQACTEDDLLSWFEFHVVNLDGHIEFVINHFDVCPKPSRDAFMQYLTRHATRCEKRLYVFLTSKNPSVLGAELSGWPSIDLSTDVTLSEKENETEQNDIINRQKIGKAFEPPPIIPIRETARSSWPVIEGAEAVDELVLSILSEQQVRRDLSTQELLLEATHGILGTYTLETVLDRVLRSIPDQNKARLAVAFLLFATRPLSSKEFATIFFLGSAVDNGEKCLPDWDLFDRFQRQRTAWFAGITVNTQSGVRLAHQRLGDIFRTPSLGSPCYFWHGVASTAHYDIAHLCLDYLARTRVLNELDSLSKQLFIVDSDLGFISYAVKYWPYHFSIVQSGTNKELIKRLRQKLTEMDLERWSRTVWLLSNPFNRSRNPWKSPFVALISLGYSEILEPSYSLDVTLGIEEAARAGNARLVSNLLELEGQDDLPQSVLLNIAMAASSSGNESLAIELIDRLSPKGRDELSKHGSVHLFRAARLGLDRLARKLLEIGTPADTEISFAQGSLMTPLCMASRIGHISNVKILLSYGANVEFKSYLQRTPFFQAVIHGDADIVDWLVKKGKANMNPTTDIRQKLTPLCHACESGNFRVVEKLLELGADPKKQDGLGRSPIIIAAIRGNRKTMQILLDYGVDIETADSLGSGPVLRYALMNGHIESCRFLLEKGANPSSPRSINPLLFELTRPSLPVPEKDRIALAKLLLEYKVDINATNEMNGSPTLTSACANSQFKLAEFLLGFDPDVNIVDKYGRTALYEATRVKSIHLVKILLEKGADANIPTQAGNIPLHMTGSSPELTRLVAGHTRNINLSSSEGANPLMLAASKGWTESVKILLDHNANVNIAARKDTKWPGWTPVMFAACYHYADIIIILAEAGADLKLQDANKDGPLHLIFDSFNREETAELDCLNALMEFQTRIDIDQVGDYGETALIGCTGIGNLRAVQRLVRAGASLTQQDNFGFTALSQAVLEGRVEIVSYLLEQGADPNIYGRGLGCAEGPLLRACRHYDYTIAKMLIDYGADINCDSASGYGTPFMAACLPFSDDMKDTDKLINYLLELDINVNARSRYVGSPLAAAALSSRPNIVHILLDRGAIHDMEDDLKRKPIHFAALNGEVNFRIIEKAGAKLGEVDIFGRSILHYAAQAGRLQVVKRILELLPELDIDTPDTDGWTALCWAARGSLDCFMQAHESEPTDLAGVVQHLLDRGADQSVKCRIGDEIWTPFQISRHTGAPEEVTTLLSSRRVAGLNSDQATEDTDELDQGESKPIDNGWWCDGCFWEMHGTFYECKVCYDFGLCPKCWHHRDIIHVFEPPHDFKMRTANSDDASHTSNKSSEADSSSVSSHPMTSKSDSNKSDSDDDDDDDNSDQNSIRSTTIDEDQLSHEHPSDSSDNDI
ncbi:ankyrin repeat-containing domain protein [Hypoxylon argillaceum]|nr:ankyrin repeat-containing domain protein [Hypoxylon argillaceum]